jgi:hypothetical protein
VPLRRRAAAIRAAGRGGVAGRTWWKPLSIESHAARLHPMRCGRQDLVDNTVVTGSWRPHDQLQLWESVRPSRARIVALRSALARLSTVSAPRVQCTVGQSASRSFGRIQFHLCVGTYWSARTRSAPFARSSLCARCRGSLSATLRACCTQRRIPWPRRLCRACVDINRSNPAKQQQQRAHGPKLSSSWARAWVGACARVWVRLCQCATRSALYQVAAGTRHSFRR